MSSESFQIGGQHTEFAKRESVHLALRCGRIAGIEITAAASSK